MFLAAKFTKFNIIFYFIQQLMFLPDFCMCAILDFETKEFINGKVFRAAVLHVCILFQFKLFFEKSLLLFFFSIHPRFLSRKKRMELFPMMALQLKSLIVLLASITSRKI